jgi:hypothetical protein
VQDHIGRFEGAHCFQGEQIGITRAGAHKSHSSLTRMIGASFGKLACCAGWRIAHLSMGQFMQNQAPLFTAWVRGQDFAAQFPDGLQPRAQVGGQLFIDLAPQPLRQSRTFTRRRDGDLQLAAAHHRAKKEIAVGNIVHAVARDIAIHRGAIDGGVHLGYVGGRNRDEDPIEVGWLELARYPFQPARARQFSHLCARLGSHNPQSRAGFEQRRDFIDRYRARTGHQAAAAVELEEDGLQVHNALWSPVQNYVPLCAITFA